MKIEFAVGASGFHQAHELKKAMHHYVNAVHHGHHSEILDVFEQAADEYMERPEFEALRENAVFEDRIEERRISPLRVWLDALMGPSAREQEMARQRIDALNRVQRAEASCFDTLAESSRMEAELEAARQRILELESALDEAAR